MPATFPALAGEPWILSNPVMPPGVTLCCAEEAAPGLSAQTGMVAAQVAELASQARRGLGRDGRTVLAPAGAGRSQASDLVVCLRSAAVTPAVVRRDGGVRTTGHPADHARLGVAASPPHPAHPSVLASGLRDAAWRE